MHIVDRYDELLQLKLNYLMKMMRIHVTFPTVPFPESEFHEMVNYVWVFWSKSTGYITAIQMNRQFLQRLFTVSIILIY